MNIYEKMAAITAELNAVAKNLRVGEGSNSYKAVGEADVLAAVKPLESKYKVYSYPCTRKIVDSDVITTKKVYKGQETEVSKFFMRLETIYRFVNIEAPEEVVEITTYGDGVDSGDKAPGKAMTYGDKYALLKAYKIITGDDPDQTASEEEKVTRGPSHESFARARASLEKNLVCSSCGNPITTTTDKWGNEMSAKDVVSISRAKFGKDMCADCMRKEMAK